MRFFLSLYFCFFQLIISFGVEAEPLNLSAESNQVISYQLHVLQETSQALSLDEAVSAYKKAQFSESDSHFLNFGIGAEPVWLHLDVNNSGPVNVRRLSIRSSWLDQLQVYFIRNSEVVDQYLTGDELAFRQRAVKSRFFEFDHPFENGNTEIYIRVVSDDPMMLPVYLEAPEAAADRYIFEVYSYGLVYGVLLALLSYNLMVFFTLKSKRYLYYSVYLLAFILMNLSYTGHGFDYFWPQATQWQQWANPLLMVVYAVSGFAFAIAFLQVKQRLSWIYSKILILSLLVISAELVLIALGNQVGALIVAFLFIFIFSITMVTLGVVSLKNGNRSARYFLIASVTHVTMATVTALTVSGLIPYTTMGYRAVEFGMVFDAILLSIALVDQFRIINEEKLQALRLAMTDHLTGVNNRRAFYELVEPIWSNCLRKHRKMSLILMDIDKFKAINDRYGHQVGDKVLKKISSGLLQNVRSGDVLARWGGEEFILFLPETSSHEAHEIAERFRQIVSSIEVEANGDIIKVTVSIGVADTEDPNENIDRLVTRADKNLYKAKQDGRNRVFSR